MEGNARMGGISAMITNQRYISPGRVSRSLFRILNGQSAKSYAGKCIGPAFNILPEDNPELPDVVEVVKGLESGTNVVRAGHQKLFEGAKVMPMPSQDAGPGE